MSLNTTKVIDNIQVGDLVLISFGAYKETIGTVLALDVRYPYPKQRMKGILLRLHDNTEKVISYKNIRIVNDELYEEIRKKYEKYKKLVMVLELIMKGKI